MSTDLTLLNGSILTMNPLQPYAEAIAITNGRIDKVGTNDDVRSWSDKNATLIDLKGKTVVPGFIDTHIHVADFGRFLTWIDLKNVGSVKEMKQLLAKRAAELAKGKWIVGRGWDQNCFLEKRFPNVSDLDEVSPDNPVILYHKCGQLCVVNSIALELAGVTKQTCSLVGGRIERDSETGELTGILADAATNLMWKVIPEPSEEDLYEGARLACEKIVEAGVTSIHWLASTPVEISIVRELRKSNKLPLRIYMVITANLMDAVPNLPVRNDLEDHWMRIGGVEILVDGFLSDKTAALTRPYEDESELRGSLLCTKEELDALVTRISKAGLQLVMHAVGDCAIDLALTSIEKCRQNDLEPSQRPRFDQAAIINKGLIERMKRQNVIASVQPLVIESEFSVYSAIERLGPDRARMLYPLKTLLTEHVHVTGGSDCPMEPLSPLLGIKAAATRKFFPEERITIEEAFRLYTTEAAYASNEENVKGSIEEGKMADLVVLSSNPLTVHPDKIEGITVLMTIVNGKVVYSTNT